MYRTEDVIRLIQRIMEEDVMVMKEVTRITLSHTETEDILTDTTWIITEK